MDNTEKNLETINDLILINNDRIAGYTKAIEDLKGGEPDLVNTFNDMIAQTQGFNADLRQLAPNSDTEGADETSVSGKLHRAWIDIKATFTGRDRKAILAECERGEDATKKAYKEALEAGSGLTPQQAEVVRKQANEQIAAHNKIKALRDAA